MSHVTSIGLDVHARSASACAFDHTAFPREGPRFEASPESAHVFFMGSPRAAPDHEDSGTFIRRPRTENRIAVARGDII